MHQQRFSTTGRVVAAVAFFFLAVTGCTSAGEQVAATQPPPEIVLSDGLAREVRLAEQAQRIVSLSPSNTEILFAIGAGPQVVGRDEFSDYPAAASQLPSVGGGWGELNLEAIVALTPDLILASGIHTVEQVQALEDLGMTVFLVPNPTTFADLSDILIEVGLMVGRQDEARSLADELVARVQAVTDRVAGKELVRVYYEVDATDTNAPFTTGQGTFGDLLIRTAGGANIAAGLQGWAQVNLEYLVASDPQVILYATAPYITTTPESLAARPGWGQITAVLNGAVYPIDTDLVDLPGPRLVDGLETIAALLHPEPTE